MVELPGQAGLSETMDGIARTRDLLQEMLDVTRSIISDAGRTIPSRDLERELRLFAESFGTSSPSIEIDVSGDEAGVSPTRREEFFIILREALCNALTHARARRITVRAHFGEGQIRGVVEDDGAGFDAATDETAAGPRQGLRSMRERVDALGGQAEISSEPGHGTRIMASFPAHAKARTASRLRHERQCPFTGLAAKKGNAPEVAYIFRTFSSRLSLGFHRAFIGQWHI
jgi:signal transduction histidine kinase